MDENELGPYHIEYNEEAQRYEVIQMLSEGMEVVDDAELEEVARSLMQAMISD